MQRICSDVVNLPYVRNIFQNLPAYLAMDLRKNLFHMYRINQENTHIFFRPRGVKSCLFLGRPILGPKNTQKTAYFFGCSKKYPFFANFNLPKVSKNPQKGVFCMSVRNILRAQNIPYAHKKSCHELSRAHHN